MAKAKAKVDDSFLAQLEADAAPPEAPSPEDNAAMKSLVEMGNELQDLRDDLDELHKREKLLKERYDSLRLSIIPDLMQKVGLVADGKGRFSNSRGGLISLRTDMHAGFPKEEEGRVHAWLRKNKMGDVIRPYVHPQTFKSLMREQLADGKAIPEFVKVHYETSATLRR